MIVKIIKYLKGYVRIQITGYSPERFLNLCSNHNILIWDLRNMGNTYEMCISIKGFKKLKPILRKTKTKLKITKRSGFPFFLHRYRKRKIFFFGILTCCLLIYLFSSYIWNIHIEGNYTRTTDILLEYLQEEGIAHGIKKSKVDCNEIVRKLREKYDNIIWVSAKIKGTRLLIHVQENTDTVLEEKQEYEPSDLIANKSGEITKIITRAGMPQVNVGDTVKAGDILVRGMIEIMDDSQTVVSREYCASDADIYAKTKYDYKDEFPLEYQHKNYTGNSKKNNYIRIFNRQIELFPKKNNYDDFEVVTQEDQLKLTENFYLPISLGSTTIKEYTLEKKAYTKAEAKAKAEENLQLVYDKLIEKGVQIIENSVKIDMNKKTCKISGEITVIEPLGQRVLTQEIQDPPEERITDQE